MFDEYGNLIPVGGSAPMTFPAMQGYGSTMAGTPYMDLMNSPTRSMGSIMSGTPAISAGPLANTATAPNFWSRENLLGTPSQQGAGSLMLGAASGLMNGFIGLKQLGIAKDTLAQNKKQFELNFGANQKMTNSRLADRQATRLASGLGGPSVNDYMKQYGI